MDFMRVLRRIRFRATRLKLRLRDLLLLVIAENQIRIPLILFVLIFLFWIILQQVQLSDLQLAVTKTMLSLSEVILGIYISFELLYTRLRPPAKDRINRPEEVVEFYEQEGCAEQFVRMTELSGWDSESAVIDTVPAVVESIPAKPLQTETLQVNLQDTYYPLPDRVKHLYDPVIDVLRKQFVDEDNYNQIKLRPNSFDEHEFEMGTTTFFNNFATNLSPDYDLFKHRTPRELLHPLVFHPDGTLQSLTETDLPYIAASAGMVVAKNGEAIFPIRSRDVAIEGMNLGLSFGGNWDKDIIATENVHAQIGEELDQERGIPDDMDVSIYYLGTLRRLELLGKPDCFVVAITDGVPDWGVASREEAETEVIRIVPEEVTVDDVDTLLKYVETVNERISHLLIDSAYLPSPGLLYWLYLLNRSSKSVTGH